MTTTLSHDALITISNNVLISFLQRAAILALQALY